MTLIIHIRNAEVNSLYRLSVQNNSVFRIHEQACSLELNQIASVNYYLKLPTVMVRFNYYSLRSLIRVKLDTFLPVELVKSVFIIK